MSVAVLDRTLNLDPRDLDVANVAVVELSPRTRMLLHGPIVPMLLRMAWPNVLVMFAQAAAGLIETWFVAKLGTDALAGMALVFPSVMLMQMISAGAIGGGISSAIARALGAGWRDEADSLVMHALVISVALGISFSVIMLLFGRPIYRALGGEGGELDAAVSYSNVARAIAFAITEAIGIAAAIWPQLWITQFSADPHVVETGTTYLRFVGPAYGFFGLGLALYFASQGVGRLFWPLSAGFLRMLVAIGAGWLALRLTGSLQWLFAAIAFGLFLHAGVLLAAIVSGAWFRDAHRQSVSSSPCNNPAEPHENLRVIDKGDLKCPSRRSTSPRANMMRLA